MAHYGWGIDCGDGTLKAVRLKSEGRALKVVKVVEIPYLDPFLKKKSPPASLDRRAVAALIQFGNQVVISDLDKVAVGFPSFHAVEGILELPRVDEIRREEMIRFEIGSLVHAPIENLASHFEHHSFPSKDLEKVLFHVTGKEEFIAFQHYLSEAGVPYDCIVSPGSALIDNVKLCTNAGSPCLVISPGFSSTTLALFNRSDFWTRTLPLGLPVGPGKEIEMARGKVDLMCDSLKRELDSFLSSSIQGGKLKLSRALLTGEGARVPAVVNALDAKLDLQVEVLRLSSKLSIDPSDGELPSESTIHTMSKAIGLAAGVLENSHTGCSLSLHSPRRRALRRLPSLTLACFLMFLLSLGVSFFEIVKSWRLEKHNASVQQLSPSVESDAVEDMQDRVMNLRSNLKSLKEAYVARKNLKLVEKLIQRFENVSDRGVFGDYHMTSFVIDFLKNRKVSSSVATRLKNNEDVIRELTSYFKVISPKAEIKGPLPAMEETPPEGLAPLAVFEVEGDLY